MCHDSLLRLGNSTFSQIFLLFVLPITNAFIPTKILLQNAQLLVFLNFIIHYLTRRVTWNRLTFAACAHCSECVRELFLGIYCVPVLTKVNHNDKWDMYLCTTNSCLTRISCHLMVITIVQLQLIKLNYL